MRKNSAWIPMQAVLTVLGDWGEPVTRKDIAVLCEPMVEGTVLSYLSVFSIAGLIEKVEPETIPIQWKLTKHGQAVYEGREETYLDPEVWERRTGLARAARQDVDPSDARVVDLADRRSKEPDPPCEDNLPFFVAGTCFDDSKPDRYGVDLAALSECFDDPLEARASADQWMSEHLEVFPHTWSMDPMEHPTSKDFREITQWLNEHIWKGNAA